MGVFVDNQTLLQGGSEYDPHPHARKQFYSKSTEDQAGEWDWNTHLNSLILPVSLVTNLNTLQCYTC